MSNIVIPLLSVLILFYGLKKKNNIFDDFIDGAKNGIKLVADIVPAILAFVLSVNIFLNSGVLSLFLGFLKPLFQVLNIPVEILPMAFLRPISGNASFAILNNIIMIHGADSYLGRLASTMQGCTDTTIYVLALYFGSIRIRKTKHALFVGLFADFMGIVASLIIVSIFF